MARPVIALAAATVLVSSAAWAAMPSGSTAGPGKSGSTAASPTISCPGDAVVWVNPRSKAYHLQGDGFFGRTKRGRFECKKAADAEGDHPVPARK